MAGTVVATELRLGYTKKITFEWTSSAGGAADGVSAFSYEGKLIGLTTIPDAVAAPTTLYDVRVNDADGHDVLLGAGANRSATATENVAEASLGAVAGSVLTLAVTAAGDAKEGTVILWVR